MMTEETEDLYALAEHLLRDSNDLTDVSFTFEDSLTDTRLTTLSTPIRQFDAQGNRLSPAAFTTTKMSQFGKVTCPSCGENAKSLGGATKKGASSTYSYVCVNKTCNFRWNQSRFADETGKILIQPSKRAIGDEKRRSDGYICGKCGQKKAGHMCPYKGVTKNAIAKSRNYLHNLHNLHPFSVSLSSPLSSSSLSPSISPRLTEASKEITAEMFAPPLDDSAFTLSGNGATTSLEKIAETTDKRWRAFGLHEKRVFCDGSECLYAILASCSLCEHDASLGEKPTDLDRHYNHLCRLLLPNSDGFEEPFSLSVYAAEQQHRLTFAKKNDIPGREMLLRLLFLMDLSCVVWLDSGVQQFIHKNGACVFNSNVDHIDELIKQLPVESTIHLRLSANGMFSALVSKKGVQNVQIAPKMRAYLNVESSPHNCDICDLLMRNFVKQKETAESAELVGETWQDKAEVEAEVEEALDGWVVLENRIYTGVKDGDLHLHSRMCSTIEVDDDDDERRWSAWDACGWKAIRDDCLRHGFNGVFACEIDGVRKLLYMRYDVHVTAACCARTNFPTRLLIYCDETLPLPVRPLYCHCGCYDAHVREEFECTACGRMLHAECIIDDDDATAHKTSTILCRECLSVSLA